MALMEDLVGMVMALYKFMTLKDCDEVVYCPEKRLSFSNTGMLSSLRSGKQCL